MSEQIRVLLSEEELDRKIAELGERISKDYEGESVHLICILKGSIFFTCELAKRITVPVTIDFMCVSSYGASTVSSGKITIKKDLEESIEGRNVIVIEDIIDTLYVLDVSEAQSLMDKEKFTSYVVNDIQSDCSCGFGLVLTGRTASESG